MKKLNYRFRGMTLVELIIASTISSLVLSGMFISLGNIYFSQKKINATQSFASESRFLMERITQLVRNNTIDYDRFFIEIGPDSDAAICPGFEVRQIPYTLRDGEADPVDLTDFDNTPENRAAIGYENIFVWNIADGAIERYRNLGGKKFVSGSLDEIDLCSQAFHGTPTELYLINEERTERTAIRLDGDRLQMQRQLGVDVTEDGKSDNWSAFLQWSNGGNGTCRAYEEASFTTPPISGTVLRASDEKSCTRGHDWTNISPKAIEVTSFEFIPGPDREPFLNYRNPDVQIQPHVFLRLNTKLRRPEDFGVRSGNAIELTQQTVASSRVFGNLR